MNPWTVRLEDQAGSEAFGETLGALLQAGDAVGLVGELGTGKTTMCRGMGRGLDCVTDLRSPSYLLCHEIQGRVPVLHMDAYFEERMDSLLGEGLCERFDAQHVLLIEWADRLADWWPEDRLEIRLRVHGEGRTAEVRGLGPRAQERLQELQESWERGGNS
ncbi:MAG: tRNA (adenosine(37)-N6)-threonylcarbamoyltransferase complex ATPase subunit type 1 TsaE [Planctomycetota bacterium]|jgi:tRNA threonylcarbamoyladenosine biosynthesis protein TsaE